MKFKFLIIAIIMLSNFQLAPGQNSNLKTAVFGGGCFWCIEAQFQILDGVESVASGYAGGQTANPTYKEVCNGTTGHAEVVLVTYDPSKLSYIALLQAFFTAHDPTTLNRQGNDIGTQYRSTIMYQDNLEKLQAQSIISELEKANVYDSKIVTEVVALDKFYPAEAYHQNYFNSNGSQPYCQYVIAPKLEKFKKVFKAKLK
jgi:peptide-methionine (S)-S-oxide reductase